MSRFFVLSLLTLTACPDGDTGSETGDTDLGTGDVDTDTADVGTDTDDTDTGGSDVDFPSYASDTLHNQSLSHEQGTCTSSAFDVVYPEEGFDNNHWAGVRLVPDSSNTPFEVDAISIELYDAPSDNGCRATVARPVLVFKQAGGDPPQRPMAGAQDYSLMPAEVLQRTYMRTTLDTPITLNSGDELWVMVQVESTSDGRTCLRGCKDSPQEANNWYTTNAMEPLGWRQLDTFPNIESTNMLIEAYDLPAEQ